MPEYLRGQGLGLEEEEEVVKPARGRKRREDGSVVGGGAVGGTRGAGEGRSGVHAVPAAGLLSGAGLLVQSGVGGYRVRPLF